MEPCEANRGPVLATGDVRALRVRAKHLLAPDRQIKKISTYLNPPLPFQHASAMLTMCEGKPEVSKCSYQEWAQITSPGLQSARNPSTTSLTDSKGQIRLRRRNGASPFIVERRPGTTGQPSAVPNSPSFGVSCRWALWSPQSWNFLFPYSSLGSPTRCPWGVLRKYWRELLPLPQCKTSWWAFKAKLHVTWGHGSKISLWVISWHHCKKRMQRAGMHWAF